jgi:hypothetical protein
LRQRLRTPAGVIGLGFFFILWGGVRSFIGAPDV